MRRRLTCEQVVNRLTDLEEGTLPFSELLRMRLHLLYCAECRELNSELLVLPELVRRVPQSNEKELLSLAQDTLKSALARVAEFRPMRRPQSSPVPFELEKLLQSGADLTLRIMQTVHQAFVDGSAPMRAPFLPATVLSQLPPSESWQWKPRGTGRVATLVDGGVDGPRLNLLVAPHGFRTPTHVHNGSEQMLILDGLLEDGAQAYPTGRWVHFGKGSTHAPLVLNEECWCLIREEGSVRYTGPLGWLRNFLAA